MTDPEVLRETRRWIQYAHEDLSLANLMVGRSDIASREACWIAQQAAEKALKALLVFLQIEFGRTHNLDVLRNLLPGTCTTRQHQMVQRYALSPKS